mmetsp:Transcript_35989/g.78835  ORF Transcript_35989/g.78835 Transcript_35989/m.78835 type:complete len:326 (+) Transcript_35989:1-978(+)
MVTFDRQSNVESRTKGAPTTDDAPDQHDEITTKMVEALTDEEKEKAARTSYRYFIASISSETPPPSAAERDRCAKLMARRHLVADKGDRKVALEKMRNTLDYRDKLNVDIIRRCFYYKDEEFANGGDQSLKEIYEYHREGLRRELSEGKLFVRGRTRGGHPLYCILTHKFTTGFRAEWYMKYNIYTLERAIAIAEHETDGHVEKVCVVFDFGRYSSKLRPPLGLSKELQFCLRDHYPERVGRVLLIDTPFIFRAFWTLIRPFIDPNTKNKISFISGEEEKRMVVGSIIEEKDAMPFMLPGAKLTNDVDIDAYLHSTPFDRMAEED